MSKSKFCYFIDPANGESCGRLVKGKNLCGAHWLQQHHGKELTPIKSYAALCTFAGCYRKHRSKGLCASHWDQKNRGVELTPLPSIPRSKAVEGDTMIDSRGYVFEKRVGHPHQDKYGWVRQHIKIMCDSLGRPLNPGESVHHKNGIRHDNRLENLELWTTSQPKGQRVEDRVEFYIEFLEEYSSLFPEKIEYLIDVLKIRNQK